MIQVKDIDILDSLMGYEFHWNLRELIRWIYGRHKKLYVTEAHRPPIRPGDVHSTDPVRAMNLRSWIFKNPRKLANDINKNWQYDPKRSHLKCCVYHRVKGGGWHFHCQVHNNTRLRG